MVLGKFLEDVMEGDGPLCLNPCCNGIGEIHFYANNYDFVVVLILVVMVLGKFDFTVIVRGGPSS